MSKPRLTQTSVTCFLHYKDEYLFVHRTKKGNSVDAGRINGVGGKLEPGEDYLSTAIRETQEETGYEIKPKDCQLVGVVKLEGGYEEDWVMCFFCIQVSTKKIPIGTENDEGQLIWLNKDKVLDSGYEVVDDLNYCWEEIINPSGIFFATAGLSEGEKVTHWQLEKLVP